MRVETQRLVERRCFLSSQKEKYARKGATCSPGGREGARGRRSKQACREEPNCGDWGACQRAECTSNMYSMDVTLDVFTLSN